MRNWVRTLYFNTITSATNFIWQIVGSVYKTLYNSTVLLSGQVDNGNSLISNLVK